MKLNDYVYKKWIKVFYIKFYTIFIIIIYLNRIYVYINIKNYENIII